MTQRQARRLLVAAFVLSLLVHLLFAIEVRPRPNEQQPSTEVVSIVRRPEAITHMQTPPPRPKITPVPHPAPTTRPARPHAHGSPVPKGGPGKGVATAPPTSEPSVAAVATPAGACPDPNAAAAVIASPPPPDIPVQARAEGTSGIALIAVKLDAAGNVTSAAVSQSTGNSSLDLVAEGMARDARYAAPLHDCKPVAGEYTYSVKFVAW